MSISAGYIVLAVLLFRILLKKAPKWINVVLWGIVGLRLICPFSMESVLSLIPSSEVVSPDIVMDNTPAINSAIPIINSVVNPVIGESFSPTPGDSANPLQILIPILSAIWIAGMVTLIIYTVVSYAKIKRKIGTAVLYTDNIYQSENVVSPFVLGIIKPKIYLPFGMNQKDMEHVVAHEMAHIRRKDHLWKPLGFLLLTLHWFNPLMWLGYVLLCRDIELACDEKVIRKLDDGQRADYSEALLACSVNRRMLAACPLAFGEVGVKQRIKSVLNYKKPTFWIIAAAVVLLIATAVCFLTNPLIPSKLERELPNLIKAQHRPLRDDDYFQFATCSVLGTRTNGNITHVYAVVYYTEYLLDDDAKLVKAQNGSHMPTVISVTQNDGEYSVLDYRVPKDGALYRDSIKDMFPWYLRPLTDTQLYIERHQKEFEQHLEDVYEINHRPEDNYVSRGSAAFPTNDTVSFIYWISSKPS
jgi:beta-lactamase regulating signal transducer with metallopeptidase domain